MTSLPIHLRLPLHPVEAQRAAVCCEGIKGHFHRVDRKLMLINSQVLPEPFTRRMERAERHLLLKLRYQKHDSMKTHFPFEN